MAQVPALAPRRPAPPRSSWAPLAGSALAPWAPSARSFSENARATQRKCDAWGVGVERSRGRNKSRFGVSFTETSRMWGAAPRRREAAVPRGLSSARRSAGLPPCQPRRAVRSGSRAPARPVTRVTQGGRRALSAARCGPSCSLPAAFEKRAVFVERQTAPRRSGSPRQGPEPNAAHALPALLTGTGSAAPGRPRGDLRCVQHGRGLLPTEVPRGRGACFPARTPRRPPGSRPARRRRLPWPSRSLPR